MKKFLLFFCAIFIFNTASAELLCVKNSNNYRVNNGLVNIKLPRLLVTSATTCPRGYTQEFSVESATGNLSSGQTMTGFWNMANGAGAVNEQYIPTSVSFPKPLAAAPNVEIIRIGAPSANCPGSANAPSAALGYLCIYEGYSENITAGALGYNAFNADATGVSPNASRYGAALYGYTVTTGQAYAWGTWAVTAP